MIDRGYVLLNARTAGDSHAVGQTLLITEGIALLGTRDGKVVVAHPGSRLPTEESNMTESKVWFITGAGRVVDQQIATNLLGPINVSRAVLPVMREQHSGHIISISSGAGLVGFAYSSVYAASKFGVEGWMGALAQEVEPFGIHTTIVNPGWFRTKLIRPDPNLWPQQSIDDYAERSAAQRRWWEAQSGQQTGDPDKLAQALLSIAGQHPPPLRFIAGSDAIALAEHKIAELHEQIVAYRNLSVSLELNDMQPISRDFTLASAPSPIRAVLRSAARSGRRRLDLSG